MEFPHRHVGPVTNVYSLSETSTINKADIRGVRLRNDRAGLSKKKQGDKQGYSAEAAARFWGRRLESTDPLAAVLTYNAPAAVNRAYDQWESRSLEKLLPRSMGSKRALDIGCGVGRITAVLASRGAAVTAVDISPAMLAACRRRLHRRGLSAGVTLVERSADDLDLRSRFDVITCFGLLEHLPERPRRECLRQALGLLKSRGRMFVVVNNDRNVLLADRYSMTRQRRDGYFVGLVGINWLRRRCLRAGFQVDLRAANPFYALLHYHLLPNRKRLDVSERQLGHLARLAVEADLAHPLDGPSPQHLASHFLVEIKR